MSRVTTLASWLADAADTERPSDLTYISFTRYLVRTAPPYLVGPALIIGYNVVAHGVAVLVVFGGVGVLGVIGVYTGFAARRGDRLYSLTFLGIGVAAAIGYWWLLGEHSYSAWPLVFGCWVGGLTALGGAAIVEISGAD